MASDLNMVDFEDIRKEDGKMFESLDHPANTNLNPDRHQVEGAEASEDSGQRNKKPSVEPTKNHEEEEATNKRTSTSKDIGSGTFQCPLCKQMFERNEKLFDHIRWQHPLICLVCSKVVEDDDSLMFHLSTHSMKLPSNCKQCLVGFSDLARLQCHMIDHMQDSKLGLQSGKHVNAMTNYERLEGGYYCKKCKKNFDTADAFHTHAFVDHKPYNSKRNTDFVCGYCSVSFSTLQQLKIHQSKEHESSLQKSVRCYVCEDVFSTNREMRVHIRKEHKPNYYYKTWSSKFSHDAINKARGLPIRAKKKKIRIKSKEVKLCVDCGATFKTDDTLKRHTLMQHSEGHTKPVCQICGKDFWTRGDLRVHIKRHMNRENRRFTCDRCGKVFGSNASLLIHQRIHTGEKPYECPECKKVFRTDSCLNRHRRIHKGLFPHTCEICQKKFRTMSNLRQHLKQRFVHKHIEGHPKPQQRHEPTNEPTVQQQQQQQHLQQPSPSNPNPPPPRQPSLWPGMYQQMGGVWPAPPQAHQQATIQHDYYL